MCLYVFPDPHSRQNLPILLNMGIPRLTCGLFNLFFFTEAEDCGDGGDGDTVIGQSDVADMLLACCRCGF